MKKTFVTSFVILGLTSTAIGKILRQGETCPDEGFYRDQADCGKFYRCVNLPPGQHADSAGSTGRYEFQCPAGTVFDQRVSTCNYPNQVDPMDNCANQEVMYPPPTAAPVQAIGVPVIPDGTYPIGGRLVIPNQDPRPQLYGYQNKFNPLFNYY